MKHARGGRTSHGSHLDMADKFLFHTQICIYFGTEMKRRLEEQAEVGSRMIGLERLA